MKAVRFFKTYMAKPSEVKREYWLIDAQGMPLGRLASAIARIVMGKHKPIYTPHIDVGDYVVVINAKKVILTGNKEKYKVYFWHSGYPGGLKWRKFTELRENNIEYIIKRTVKGMLDDNRLRKQRLNRIIVIPDNNLENEKRIKGKVLRDIKEIFPKLYRRTEGEVM